MKRGTVFLAYAHGGTVSGEFARTLTDNVLRNPGRVGAQSVQVGGPMIADHRNLLVYRFLENEQEWLWMLDSDMVLQPDTLDRMVRSAHWKDRPMLGALCFGANRSSTNIFPTVYAWTEEGIARGENVDFRTQGLLEVEGTGAACVLIHRSVVEKVVEEYPPPKGPFEFAWYDKDGVPQRIGEDLMFCVRVRNAGFPIYVDCDIQIGHVKPVILDVDYWERWQIMKQLVADGTG